MAGAISPRVLRALIAVGAAAVLALWWHSTLARIDAVSGATYTSGGYVKSLQSALDNGV